VTPRSSWRPTSPLQQVTSSARSGVLIGDRGLRWPFGRIDVGGNIIQVQTRRESFSRNFFPRDVVPELIHIRTEDLERIVRTGFKAHWAAILHDRTQGLMALYGPRVIDTLEHADGLANFSTEPSTFWRIRFWSGHYG
jgi:hypothetical protein